MLWNGKRCESKLATEEEIKEMEKQLKEADTLEEIISKLFLSFLDDKIELFQNHDIIEMDIA